MTLRWPYIIAAYALLLTASYLDNVRGLLLPIITKQYDINYATSSGMLVAAHIAAVLMTASLVLLFRFFSDRMIVICASLLAVACCLWPFYFAGYRDVLLWSLLMGGTMSMMGALCNVLTVHGTPPSQLGRTMSGMQAMYGLGSMLAPILAIVTTPSSGQWATLLYAPLLGAIAIIALARQLDRTPSIRQSDAAQNTPVDDLGPKNLRWLCPVIFVFYVAGEVMISMWMITYFVEHLHKSVAQGSVYLGGFFACMTTTRLLASLLATPGREAWFVYGSVLTAAAGFWLGLQGHSWGFVAAGVLGPFYPIMLARVNQRFTSVARQITVLIIVAAQFGLACVHALVGRLADTLGMSHAYYLPLAAFALCLLTTAIFDWRYARR